MELVGDLLKLLQTLDVIFHVLAAGAGTGGGNRVGRLDDKGDGGGRLNVAVVRLNGMNDLTALAVLLRNLNAKLDMRTLGFLR